MADDAPATFSERFPETVGNQSESELRQAAAAYQQGQYGRALSAGLSGLVAGAGETIAGLFTKSSDAFFKGLTPSQEIEVGANAALTQIGGGEAFRVPKGTAAAFDNFHEQVVKPAAQSFTGAPTQVEPPKNTDVPPSVSRSQLALTGEPHIDAILTSPVTKNVIDNPIVDRSHDVPYTAGGSVPLQDPTMFIDKNFPRAFSIDGKVFDPADPFLVHENVEQHTMDILTKGGMDDATAYKVAHFEFAEKAEGAWYQAHGIDQAKAETAYAPYMAAIQKGTLPELSAIEASGDKILYQGVRHQRVGGPEPNAPQRSEYWTTDLDLAKTYAGPDGFLRVAKWSDFPQEARDRGFHNGRVASTLKLGEGGNPATVMQVPEIGRLPARPNFPPNLYDRPYPHDEPSAARNEAIAEPRPTPAEIDRAKQIIADWQSKPLDEQTQPEAPPRVNPLQQAHELGVIGQPREEVPTDSPAAAAQRAIPASIKDTGDKITMTPAGEQISEFERRFNYKMERIEAPADFKQLWKESAAENSYFPEARSGTVNPAHLETLAEDGGIDPTLIKRGYIKSTFDGPAVVRMADQTLRALTKRHQEASLKVESDPSPQNIAEMLKAEILRDYALEQSTGLDAEWGHTGHALRSLMQARKSAVSTGLTEGLKPPKPVKDLADAIDEFKEKTTKAVSSPGKEGALGLDKLIQAAADLVDEVNKPVKEGEKPSVPMSPDVKELVKRAQAVTNLLDIKRPVDPKTGTVLPLRKILTSNEPAAQSIHAKFNKIISEGERTLIEGIRKGKTPQAAMPPEFADMIQRAENVTNYFGGAGIEKAVQDILASKGRTIEDMQNLARAVNRTDIKGTARLLSLMRGQNPNFMYWLWVQGLISGPFTHAKYVLANASYAAMERGVTTPMAAIIGRLVGRADADRVLGGEAMAGAWGWIHGVPDAMKASWESIKLGQRFQLESEKRLIEKLAAQGEQIPKELLKTTNAVTGINRPIDGLAGRILGFPGDAAGAIHTFFRRAGEEGSKSAAAYREAVLEGKKISDPDFWDRMNWHKANLSTEKLQEIIDDANRGTFMRELPPSMKRLQSAVKQGKYLKWIFPFMHIPIDLARAFQEHTPLAFADPEFRADLLGRNGGRKQDLAISRVISGSAIMGYFTHKFMTGQSTGSYPSDPKERQEWKLMGKIPYAIQIGDEWHSFERFGPAGALAGLGADIGKIISASKEPDDEKWTQMVWMAAEAAMNTMADFPGFQSIQNLMRAKEDPQEGARFMAWQAGSLLPFSSLVSQTASFLDPSMRKARTFVDGLLYRVPGARETVLPNRDPLYGTPVHNPGYESVIRNAPVQKDYAKSELDRVGYYPTAPANHIGGVKLSPQQYDKYEATAGPLVNAALNGLVRSSQWQAHRANPEWQKEVAKSVISAARRKAAGAMLMDDPSLIEAGRQRRLTQIDGPR